MSKKIKQIALILLGCILLNFVSNKIFKRFDLTHDKRYTLSDVSKNITKRAKRPILTFKI